MFQWKTVVMFKEKVKGIAQFRKGKWKGIIIIEKQIEKKISSFKGWMKGIDHSWKE